MFCKHCGSEVDDNAYVCLHCGRLVKEEQAVQQEGNGMAVAGFICSFFIPLLGWIFGGIGLKRSKERGGKGKAFSIAAIVIASVVFVSAFALI